MLVLHLVWAHGRFFVWAESERRLRLLDTPPTSDSANSSAHDHQPQNSASISSPAVAEHPFAAETTEIHELLRSLRIRAAHLETVPPETPLRLRLPADKQTPQPSPRLAGPLQDTEEHREFEVVTEWQVFEIPAVTIQPEFALQALAALDAAVETNLWCRSQSTHYWVTAARFISGLLVGQRVVPSMAHRIRRGLAASWRLWLHDDDLRRRVGLLLRQMPPVARSVVGVTGGSGGGNGGGTGGGGNVTDNPWSILENMLSVVTDATVRRYLREQELIEAVEDFDPLEDVHVAWLSGLLDRSNQVVSPPEVHDVDTLGRVRAWLGRLADTGDGQEFRLRLQLHEPSELATGTTEDYSAPGADLTWPLTFHLESTVDAEACIDAERIWALQGDIHFVEGHRLDNPQEVLLRELARAGSIYDEIQAALEETQPTRIELSTRKAHLFMRDLYPILKESGFRILVPDWWDQPEARLAARLQVESQDLPDEVAAQFGFDTANQPVVGLESFVKCSWRIALGEHTLTDDEFKWLSKQNAPLVRLRGQWVELRAADLNTALKFFDDTEAEQIPLRAALRLAYGPESETAIGLPVVGMDATGWVGRLFGSTGDASDRTSNDSRSAGELIKPVAQPEGFIGSLRPYQLRGLSWFAFLERFGLGACLADDMGLGKTIQLIALLLRERELAGEMAGQIGPTLLIVPTSVVGNWTREIKRFGPTLRCLVHHGSDRWSGDTLAEQIAEYDVVITTFALAYRDREDLNLVDWWRVCLDEAQNIKNPVAKQTRAIRAFKTIRRIALTGTPVENRLNELWSIMEFCNPGYLGTAGEFRRQFAIPIERYNERSALGRLRGFVQPFVLRRLKTDPRVIADLPEKLEHKVYCSLTTEQARLYERTVDEMLNHADTTDGIRKRGIVLALLTKLKQICNHPAHFSKKPKEPPWASAVGQSRRSGKTARLLEMLEEVLAEGDSALVFTQFREMGHLLSALLQHDLGIKPIFLHGGTPAKQREKLVDLFQKRDGTHPVFLLSLKAGGIGLNLTAANHVFHFDRWWNPAVENQATDRAFRIGQTRAVQVHKFVCSGTLEERIDQMLEQKTELAENVIGTGDQWLTDLSSDQLRDILTLRCDDIADDIPEAANYDDQTLTEEASSLLGA